MSKVIAIEDATTTTNGFYHNGLYLNKAYYKGDIFELYKEDKNFLVIYHNDLEMLMDVDPSKFVSLEDWRQSRIDILEI